MGSNDRTEQDARMDQVQASLYGFPDDPVTDAKLLRNAMDTGRERGFNLLGPLTHLTYMPPGYLAAIRIVRFPLDGEWRKAYEAAKTSSNGTWYTEGAPHGTAGAVYCLHKTALRQLAAAAGASIYCSRTDDGKDGYRWEYTATVKVRTMDGVWREVQAPKDLDLRDESPVIIDMHETARRNGRKDANLQISKARAMGSRLCATKAANAAIRDALGIKTQYTRAEALNPFLFPMLIFVPNSPEARQMQAAAELGLVGAIYGQGAQGKAFAPDVIDVEETTPATSTTSSAPATTTPPAAQRTGPAPESRQIAEMPPIADGDWDMELARLEGRIPVTVAAPATSSSSRTLPAHPDDDPKLRCAICGNPTSTAVANYATRVFREVRCLDHQRDKP